MISYKDMTFCGYYKNCKHGKECGRALTPYVEKQAKIWWGGDDAPISLFGEKPQCFWEK